MKKIVLKGILFALLFTAACDDNGGQAIPPTTKPNILFIIADDMGLDATPGYALGTTKPQMPNIENLANAGIIFDNVWSNPTCTPTRSSIITGKYGIRTAVTQVGDELSITETSLQKYLDDNNAGYNHAVIGKWHLSENDATHPTKMGVGYYAGLLSGAVASYTNWDFTENEQTSTATEYSTTKFTDLAINWLGQQTEPWFLWLAYNAPHTPFHLPPSNLHTQGNLPDDQASIDANPLPYYMAMIEAMDAEIGRVLSSLSAEELANTIIIFIGDNGTPGQVIQAYSINRAKGTVYQGGVNVPMIIAGKGVNRINERENALINTTDLFATIGELAGISQAEIHDSKSFKALLSDENDSKRNYVYTEAGSSTGNGGWAIRNATHKYIQFENGDERFYNLSNNPLENPNLLSTNQLPLTSVNEAIKNELTAESEKIRQ